MTPQALIQVGTHIIDIRAVRFADLSLSEEGEGESWPELVLIFDRTSAVLYRDDALAVWTVLCNLATPVAITPQPQPVA